VLFHPESFDAGPFQIVCRTEADQEKPDQARERQSANVRGWPYHSSVSLAGFRRRVQSDG